MDSTFTEYPDSPEVTPIAKDKKNKCMSDWERKYKKQLKKQKKMLKQFIKMQKRNERERQAAKEAEAAKVDEVKKNGFLSKLGDAFVKAVPAVLTAAVTAVIGIIFKRTRKKEDESQAMAKALQQAMKAVMA